MKTSIVTTTINVPFLLRRLAENARAYGHDSVEFVVIGDRKTSPEASDFCRKVDRDLAPVLYQDLEQQRKYLSRFPALWSHLPFDSIQRRNVGLLYAYEHGADLVITIDDDNFGMNQDFIGLHSRAGRLCRLPTVESTSGWFNVCSTLEEETNLPFYHRGFPMGQRWREAEAFFSESTQSRRVAVNAGFWLDDPDIDAITRLHRQPVVRGMKKPAFALEPGTWCPFNSLNTALERAAIPAYFLGPFIGRYDDIWASYIVTRIAGHLGEVIAFGDPLVRQKRNAHNLWRDLDNERNGMLMTDQFCIALRELELHGETYHACYGEIAARLGEVWTPDPSWTASMLDWRSRYLDGMNIWHDVFSRLSASSPSSLTLLNEACAPPVEADAPGLVLHVQSRP